VSRAATSETLLGAEKVIGNAIVTFKRSSGFSDPGLNDLPEALMINFFPGIPVGLTGDYVPLATPEVIVFFFEVEGSLRSGDAGKREHHIPLFGNLFRFQARVKAISSLIPDLRESGPKRPPIRCTSGFRFFFHRETTKGGTGMARRAKRRDVFTALKAVYERAGKLKFSYPKTEELLLKILARNVRKKARQKAFDQALSEATRQGVDTNPKDLLGIPEMIEAIGKIEQDNLEEIFEEAYEEHLVRETTLLFEKFVRIVLGREERSAP